MEQVQEQAPQIKQLLDSSNQFYQELLGYQPEQISLQQIPENQWNEFATQRELNPNSSGIYLPRNQTAIVRDENPLSLFHEYFGHGLYCEQSLAGRKLVNLEKRLLEEERQEFSNSRFSLEDLQRFRQQNQTFQELENLRQENLGRYELFAIWTEYLLSGEFGLRDSFGRKYDSLSGQEKEAIDSVINFSSRYGNLATMYAQGMARRTTVERVGRLLEDVYGDKLQDVRFALLYGSRKDFSDIDVFIVSEDFPEIDSWLDVRTYSRRDFEGRLNLFDIAVTNPLVTGEFILGNRDYFEHQKNLLVTQPINEESIRYNLQESVNQRKLAENYPKDSKDNLRGLMYSLTYLKNALAFESGVRLFTKEDLFSYSLRASAEGDKLLQL